MGINVIVEVTIIQIISIILLSFCVSAIFSAALSVAVAYTWLHPNVIIIINNIC